MKKIITLSVAVWLLISTVITANAAGLHWYCKRNAEHKQPMLDTNMRFIEEVGGYYIDRAHGDECEEKVIYLTFDVGYENGNVEKIMDVMKAQDVKGAFFILSNVIARNPELNILAESEESGVYMVMAREGREIFLTGHSEYSPMTLDTEYRRDLSKGLPIEMPLHYYRNDDPEQPPLVRWRGHANLLFNNWLNYYVYQATPYHLEDIK